MRRFYLESTAVVDGAIGVGAIIEGVQFLHGPVVFCGLDGRSYFSFQMAESMARFVEDHVREGETKLRWVDGEHSTPPSPAKAGDVNVVPVAEYDDATVEDQATP